MQVERCSGSDEGIVVGIWRGLRFIDLCSGIGGIRLAIEAAGGQCVFSSEIDPKARLVYHANYGEWPSGDITKIQAEDVPDHDLLCAGFPCQPFSLSGKRLGFEDATRGTIFFDIVRIARAKRPAAILLENVKGLKSHDGGRTLATIVGALEEIGYRVATPKVLNASLFGCPTARERVFIVALRSDLGIGNFKFPEPTSEIVCLDDVLLPDSETDRWVVRGRQVFIDEEAVARAEGKSALEPVRVGLVDNRDAQGYRVYSDQGHAITFCAHGGGIGAKTGLYWINGRVRRLDPRECLAVMGYPKSFVIPPSISPDQVRTLIGNSVAVVVVRRAYESIVAALAEVGHRSINVTSSSARLVSTKTDARTALDLFAGCGGFSQGFQEEGFEVVGACQWDPKIPAIARTYEANHPGTVMVDADITLPETKERICRLFENRHCDVIIGGPPCGPFSRSGKRDPNDPRARLFIPYLEIVGRVMPSVAVMENVQPLLSARNPSGGLVIDEITEGFRRLGYEVEYKVVLVADCGVPQLRKRLFIVASRLGVPIRFPAATHAEHPAPSSGLLPWVTIRGAIGDLEQAPEDRAWSHVFTRHSPSVAARYGSTPIGKKGCCLNYNEGAYRNPPDRPSVTIKTAAWPLHYLHSRDLTCREAARVQSFPDDFRFTGGKTAVATMIGNAVPSLMAGKIALCTREMLDEARAGQPDLSAIAVARCDSVVAPVVPSVDTASDDTALSSRLLCNGSSKKGQDVWALSIGMPGGKCPFASPICAKLCYAETGQFPLHAARYKANYQATTEPDFVGRICTELNALAWRNSGDGSAVCIHEKGELYSLDYLRKWGQVFREMRSFANLAFFAYTRSWISPAFRAELDRIAMDCANVRINLSVDRSMIERHGVPARVGNGLLVYLAETDEDLPPVSVDIVLRNLRIRGHQPVERLGGVLVCPNESGLYIAKNDGEPVIKGGKAIRVRCQDCRLCIDRELDRWERVKARYAGSPGLPGQAVTAA